MTSIRLTHTALAIAVAAALTSGVAAAAEQTMPSVNTDVLTGQSGDTLKTVSHQEYENKGTIKNFGTIHLAIWSTLTNSGNIENIGSFTGESDASRLVNKASGTIHPENRGIYTQSDSPKKSSRNIWSLAVVSVDQRY